MREKKMKPRVLTRLYKKSLTTITQTFTATAQSATTITDTKTITGKTKACPTVT